jgi:hypothetical protein
MVRAAGWCRGIVAADLARNGHLRLGEAETGMTGYRRLAKNTALIGSRGLTVYSDVDGPSAANNHLWSRKYTARLL